MPTESTPPKEPSALSRSQKLLHFYEEVGLDSESVRKAVEGSHTSIGYQVLWRLSAINSERGPEAVRQIGEEKVLKPLIPEDLVELSENVSMRMRILACQDDITWLSPSEKKAVKAMHLPDQEISEDLVRDVEVVTTALIMKFNLPLPQN